MSKKHALIIGINSYQFMEQQYQLHGCVNDAKLLKSTLINKFNFDRDNVVTLYDQMATRDAILAQMDALSAKVQTDDIVVFHFSGHGQSCRVKTDFTDEGSGKLNSILPCDDSEPTVVDPITSPDGVIWREIREHKINNWLQELAKKTANITLIFDACHSGTITRSSNKTKARTVPLHIRNQIISQQQLVSEERDNLSKPRRSNWLTLSDNFVVISGCRDTQESQEMDFYEGNYRFRHGVLTYNFCKALNYLMPGTTYRDVFETLSTQVVLAVENQNPQIEGTVDREVFGIKDIVPLSFIPVSKVHDDKVLLAGGAAHGVSLGSSWDVYPPFTKIEDPSKRIAQLEIVAVEALHCEARVVQQGAQIEGGARCVATAATLSLAIKVNLSQLSEREKSKLSNRIMRTNLVDVVAFGEVADLNAEIVLSPAELAHMAVPEAAYENLSFPVWAFFDKQDKLAMPLHSANERSVEVVLVENLQKVARYRNIMGLHNRQNKLEVEFNLYKKLPDNSLLLANGGSTDFVENSDAMVLEFINNDPQQTVFLNLLWISANREVAQVFPHNATSEEISPGKTIRIGNDRPLTAHLAKNYYYDMGSETLKAFFTNKPVDFRWLNQQGVRDGDIPATHITNIDQAFEPNHTQPPTFDDDWDVISRSLLLTRRLVS